MHLKKDPVNLLAQPREDAGVKGAEAVEHPGLLVVGKVLDGKIVTKRITCLGGDAEGSRSVMGEGGVCVNCAYSTVKT